MICRCATPAIHSAREAESWRDTNLANQASAEKQIADLKAQLASMSPDNTQFEIEEIEERGHFLIIKAKYPNCAKCAYEGNKVMVFEGVKVKDAIKWRVIDPHFRQGGLPPPINTAPPPVARFPASDQGWRDALSYVQIRNGTMIVSR